MSTPPSPLDPLLTRYLHLLDEYTTLRTQLTHLQSSVRPPQSNPQNPN